MRILGLDPGLATFGLAVIDVENAQPRVIHTETFMSKKSDKKQRMLQSDDRLRRLRDLIRWLDDSIQRLNPRVVAAESFSPPRNASAASAVAMAWGAMTTLVEQARLPFVHAGPQEWRKTLYPQNPDENYVHADLALKIGDKLPTLKGEQPHALDATGVGLWALTTDLVRGLVRA